MHSDQHNMGAADFDAGEPRHVRGSHELHSVSQASATSAPKASETRYRRLFEAAQDGILVIDAETGVIADANPYLEGLLGYDHGEMVGRPVWELDAFQEVIANRHEFQELQSGQGARFENLNLEAKGKDVHEVEFTSNMYLVDSRRFMQCNIRNNAGRGRAAGELQTANGALEILVTALRNRDAGMQLLNRMSSLLQACNTQDEACRVIAMMAAELFPDQDGSLAILRQGSPELEVVAHWGSTEPVTAGFAPHDCWAIRRGQPHDVVDLHSGLLCRHFVDVPRAGYLCIPLTVQGESLGLLCLVGDRPATSALHQGQRDFALTIAEAVKLSLYNLRLQERLREQATRDVLTGLVNRRYLEESLGRELHRSRRAHTSLGLAMLDLDRFKQFNDAFGHEAGDTLLTEVGSVLGSVMRQSDIACRYGGEEFVLVFPETSFEDTCHRVEQIRAMIRGLAVRHDDRLLGTITVSAGVAMAPEHGTSARLLLAAADDAMYRAKHAGRDRLVRCDVRAAPPADALLVIQPSRSGPGSSVGCTSPVVWRNSSRP